MRAPKREVDISFATRLLFATYFLEAGLILLIAPWSGFWDRNFFAAVPALQGLVASPYTRGAVSGLGLVTVLAGLSELAAAFSARRRASTVPPNTSVSSDR